VPLMDNNLMLQVETLGPLLDAFLRDGVEFYPMRWSAGPAARGEAPLEMYSIMFSPCGKVLIEVAARCAGGRPPQHFHALKHARASFQSGNQPESWTSQPLVPLRVSKAVSASTLENVLAFYGLSNSSNLLANAADLGFQTKLLSDEVDGDTGVRAVTIMLSPDAKTHMQFWVRPREEPTSGPGLPSAQAFRDAVGRTQRDASAPQESFCKTGSWTVDRYISYQLQVHETVMVAPPEDLDTNTPPAGFAQDIFIDDHISWDCTAPACNVAKGGKALYRTGSRIQWMDASSRGFPGWGPYGYDPAGYSIQLHWSNTPEDFTPKGRLYPICFNAESDQKCQGAHVSNDLII